MSVWQARDAIKRITPPIEPHSSRTICLRINWDSAEGLKRRKCSTLTNSAFRSGYSLAHGAQKLSRPLPAPQFQPAERMLRLVSPSLNAMRHANLLANASSPIIQELQHAHKNEPLSSPRNMPPETCQQASIASTHASRIYFVDGTAHGSRTKSPVVTAQTPQLRRRSQQPQPSHCILEHIRH
jgi:hypothetical protein